MQDGDGSTAGMWAAEQQAIQSRPTKRVWPLESRPLLVNRRGVCPESINNGIVDSVEASAGQDNN